MKLLRAHGGTIGLAALAILCGTLAATFPQAPAYAQVAACPPGYGYSPGYGCVPAAPVYAPPPPVYVEPAPISPVYDALALAFGVGDRGRGRGGDHYRGHNRGHYDGHHDRR